MRWRAGWQDEMHAHACPCPLNLFATIDTLEGCSALQSNTNYAYAACAHVPHSVLQIQSRLLTLLHSSAALLLFFSSCSCLFLVVVVVLSVFVAVVVIIIRCDS